MSVILDALRREGAPAAAAAGPAYGGPPAVPAGLGVGGPVKPAAAGRTRTRPGLLWTGAVALVVAAALSVRLPELWTVAALPQVPPPAASAAALIVAAAGIAPPATAVAIPEEPSVSSAPAAPRIAAAPSSASRHASAPQRPIPAVESASVAAAAPVPAASSPAASVSVSAPSPVPADDFQLAVRHQALGHYEQALLHYMAALRANEFNVEARNNLGLLYHDRGLSTEAIDQFRRALLIDPRYVKARSNLAVVLMEAGRLAEARTELRAARAAEPASVDLLVNEALIEKADRQPDAAVEVLLQALRLQPRHAMANYNIAILYEERGSVPLAYDHYRTFLSAAAPEHAPLVPHVEERLAALGPRLTTGAAR